MRPGLPLRCLPPNWGAIQLFWEPDVVIRNFYNHWKRQVSSPEAAETGAVCTTSARMSSQAGGTHPVVGRGDGRASSGKNSLCKGPEVGYRGVTLGSRGEESWLERLMRFSNCVSESQPKEFCFVTMQNREDLRL